MKFRIIGRGITAVARNMLGLSKALVTLPRLPGHRG